MLLLKLPTNGINLHVGKHASNNYTAQNGERLDGKRADVLLIPTTAASESLPPILVEIQNVVDRPYMHRLSKYYYIDNHGNRDSNNDDNNDNDSSNSNNDSNDNDSNDDNCRVCNDDTSNNNNDNDSNNSNDNTNNNINNIPLPPLAADHNSTVERLIEVATETKKQFKRILEVPNEETCLHKYQWPVLDDSDMMPTPLDLPPNVQPPKRSTHVDILSPMPSEPQLDDMKYARVFKEEYLKTHKQMKSLL
ncbi:hypothetical protein G6F56_002063 [Rhizopus delemar]|nr:hypothetical protein G6F56_002063 [Rhizopus delemar]